MARKTFHTAAANRSQTLADNANAAAEGLELMAHDLADDASPHAAAAAASHRAAALKLRREAAAHDRKAAASVERLAQARAQAAALDILGRLLDWADRTGSWEAQVWREANRLHRSAKPGTPRARVEAMIGRLLDWAGMMGGWEAGIWREAEALCGREDAGALEAV